MPLLEWVRGHLLLAAVGAGALVGAVIGLFIPIRAAAPPTAQESAWVLPTPQSVKRFDEAKFVVVSGARFWGDIATPGDRAPRASNWDLTAIVTRPGLQVAVSTGAASSAQWVQVGGQLPDGSVLVAANRDTVWYEKDGCRRARALYPSSTKPESDACIGAGQPAPAATPGAPAPNGSPARPTASAVRRTN